MDPIDMYTRANNGNYGVWRANNQCLSGLLTSYLYLSTIISCPTGTGTCICTVHYTISKWSCSTMRITLCAKIFPGGHVLEAEKLFC